MPYKDKERNLAYFREYHKANKEKRNLQSNEYHHAHKEINNERSREYSKKNKERICNIKKEKFRYDCNNLTDDYILHVLKVKSKLKASDIRQYPELIEAKRAQLMLLRATK